MLQNVEATLTTFEHYNIGIMPSKLHSFKQEQKLAAQGNNNI